MAATTTEQPNFDELLSRVVDIAARAPSSHNSQPWAVALLSSRASREAAQRLAPRAREGAKVMAWFAIAIDAERELRALPDLHVEMIASCGMFLDALARLLREEGIRCHVSWLGDGRSPFAIPGWPTQWRGIAVVAASPMAGRSFDDASKTIGRLLEQRRTNRAPFEREAPREDLDWVSGARAAMSTTTRGAVRLHLVEERRTIERAAKFVRSHGARDLVHDRAWRETYSYIRFAEREARAHEDGFDVAQLFGPLGTIRRSILRYALSPAVMRALRWTPYADTIARGLGDRIVTSAALLCVTVSDEPSAGAVLEAGGLAMDAWLRATARGLGVHPVSVALQHEDLRLAFERELGLRDRLVFFARVGRPINARVSTIGMTARRAISIKTL